MRDKQIELQNAIQEEALIAHKEFNFRSTVALVVGAGKSAVAIKRLREHYKKDKKFKAVFFGCRELYLENFKVELKKFKETKLLKNITFICTQSLKSLKDKYDIIIGDESHKHPDSYVEFLKKQILLNPKVEILCLTGTPIKSGDIFGTLQALVPISIERNVDDSTEEGLINDYKIIVYRHTLSDVKNIHIKTNQYNFYTSELASYIRLMRNYAGIENMSSSFPRELQFLKLFFKNLASKAKYANDIINSIKKNSFNEKILLYSGTINQTSKFNYDAYHSKLSKEVKLKNYKNFCSNKGEVLVNVDGIKESVTIPNLKHLVICHAGASDKGLKQILGRSLRLVPEKEIGTVHILVAKNTIEETWFSKSIAGLDKNKIEYVELS